MSFVIDRAGWTEDELAAGVHVLASGLVEPDFGDDDHFLHDENKYRASDWEALFDEAGAELVISSLSSTSDIRTRLSQYILEGEKKLIVERYANRERLPAEFRAAAERSDAIPILIKSFLRKILRLHPTQDIVREILALSSDLLRNCNQRTVYERVGDVQKYIHHKADEARHPGAHLDLPSEVMRHLLSSSRLHLSLQDMFGVSTAYWNAIWDAETSASVQEAVNPNLGFIPVGKRRVKLWRVPHMKPLTHFASRQSRAILKELGKLALDMPLEDYRRFALEALSVKEEAQPVEQPTRDREALKAPPFFEDIPF